MNVDDASVLQVLAGERSDRDRHPLHVFGAFLRRDDYFRQLIGGGRLCLRCIAGNDERVECGENRDAADAAQASIEQLMAKDHWPPYFLMCRGVSPQFLYPVQLYRIIGLPVCQGFTREASSGGRARWAATDATDVPCRDKSCAG